jgi:hypothetical protein
VVREPPVTDFELHHAEGIYGGEGLGSSVATDGLVRADSVLEDIADGLEFCVFGYELAIADDRAEFVFGNGFGDLALHSVVEGGSKLAVLKGCRLGSRA